MERATWLRYENLDEPFVAGREATGDDRSAEAIADGVAFEVLDVDNAATQRDPAIALTVTELRVICAKCFLTFRESNDRL